LKSKIVVLEKTRQTRDITSALAIELSGLFILLFGQTFHPFSNIGHSNTVFKHVATIFLNERTGAGCIDTAIRDF
jgi:hypothetical protein